MSTIRTDMRRFSSLTLAALLGGLISGLIVWYFASPLNVPPVLPAGPDVVAETLPNVSPVQVRLEKRNNFATEPVSSRLAAPATVVESHEGPAATIPEPDTAAAPTSVPGSPTRNAQLFGFYVRGLPATPNRSIKKTDAQTPFSIRPGALAWSLAAADTYQTQGFSLIDDYWAGTVPQGSSKAQAAQLQQGLEYWFWAGTADQDAMISIHVYDSSGHIAEAEAWQRPHQAGSRVRATKTDGYIFVVGYSKPTAANADPEIAYAVTYGFRGPMR